jgi:hypothetical protein
MPVLTGHLLVQDHNYLTLSRWKQQNPGTLPPWTSRWVLVINRSTGSRVLQGNTEPVC